MEESMHQILDELAIKRAISRISNEIIERNKGVEDVVLVGILTRGVEIGKRIKSQIDLIEGGNIPLYTLDSSFFRDDQKRTDGFKPMDFMGKINNKNVVLIDDVIYTGRTVRAAMDALMVRDRPKSVQLVALIDRGHRELPIRGDFIGKNVPTSKSEKVIVRMKNIDKEDSVYLKQNGG